ncbi:MAG: hypothetical protein VKJ64_21635 [Leptolyngbyaceae bacterium]|nr:hypothetical protein [Leptolyngbyaceae bacterium]
MNRPKILRPDESYTFSRYAELPYERDEILADLGGTISSDHLSWPSYSGNLDLRNLRDRLNAAFQFTTISSEQARREFLIAPLLSEICQYTHQKVRVEYTLVVNNWLKGSLDYYFQASNFLIIEAKRENIYTGFTQLGAELIALDQWIDSDASMLYGAVSTGQIWQFGQFQRHRKHLTEDLTLYRIPEELDPIARILLGIIATDESPNYLSEKPSP